MTPLKFPNFTPDDRLWRINWYGDVLFPGGMNTRSQPNIQVAISPVRVDPTNNEEMLSSQATDSLMIQRFFPVGMLPYVRVGDVWQNGERKYSPDYQREHFHGLNISRETSKLIKSGLPIDEIFVLPLKQHPWHYLLTGSYCLSLEASEGIRLVIPAMELIRFYFGSSSELLHRLFMHDIKYETLWQHHHYAPYSGQLHLKLAKGLSGVSAADIGRIALSNQAMRAATRIRSSCQKDLLAGEKSVYPQTGFPFEGKTDLVVVGKWLPFGNVPDSTFVVYRIESCSHPFPFKKLSYEVTDDKKVSRANKHQAEQSTGNPSLDAQRRRSKIHKAKVLGEADPSNTRSQKRYQFEANNRFPDLLRKEIWREKYETQDPPELWPIFTQENQELVSVGDLIGASSNTTSVDIIATEWRSPLQQEARLPKFVKNEIDRKIKQENLDSNSVSIELITLPGYTHPVFSLPSLIDENGEVNPVSICNGGKGMERCRRGCFVKISAPPSEWRLFVVESTQANRVGLAIGVDKYDLKESMRRLLVKSQDSHEASSQVFLK